MSEVAATPAPATATAIDNVAAVAPKAVPSAPQGQPTEVKAEAPAKAEPEWLEYVADGRKQRVTKEEALRKLSLSDAANKRFEEAAAMRKQSEEVLNRLKDPSKAIEMLMDPKLGLSEDQIRTAFEEWYTKRVIAPSQMTEEQRRLAEAQERISKYEQAEAARKKEAEEVELKARDEQMVKTIQEEVIATLEQSKLPKSRFTVNRIAYWTKVNEAKGLNAPRDLIVQQVRKEMREIVDGLTSEADGDMLVELLGEGTVKKIRSHDLNRIRAQRQANLNPPKPVAMQPSVPRETKEFISEAEVSRRIRDLWK